MAVHILSAACLQAVFPGILDLAGRVNARTHDEYAATSRATRRAALADRGFLQDPSIWCTKQIQRPVELCRLFCISLEFIDDARIS